MSSVTAPRIWKTADLEREASGTIARELGVNRLVAQLVCSRGIRTVEAAEQYFRPGLNQCTAPDTLTGMKEAVDRIERARSRNERVLVFGDYDVDGITGTAIMMSGLRRYGLSTCEAGLPHRMNGGYGLSGERIEEAAQDGVQLIITVDNGSTAFDAAARARELGIDLIVTDHHTLGAELPPAAAVINPHREGPAYPGKAISGSAVAAKLIWALTGDQDDMDLAALGTVADVMPLQGENRGLVAHGIEQIRRRPRLGVMELARVSRINTERLTSEDIAFQLAPRLNAAGRLGSAHVALDLLTTNDPDVATAAAKALDQTNSERRAIEAEMTAEALEMISIEGVDHRHSIVLARPNWHPGVVGIVAARIQRLMHRPTILIALDDRGYGAGSARSIPECNIAEVLAACESYLVRHGGHGAAGGLAIEAGKVEAFSDAVEREVERRFADGLPTPVLHVDAQVSLSQIDAQLVQWLEQLQPFGNANPAPVFCTYGVEIVADSARAMGTDHIRLRVREGVREFNAVGFGMGSQLSEIAHGSRADIAFTPRFDTYRNDTSVQLLLKDLRVTR